MGAPIPERNCGAKAMTMHVLSNRLIIPPRLPVHTQHHPLGGIVLCCVLWAAIGVSCERSSGGSGNPNQPAGTAAARVYTAGSYTEEGVTKACYWKDGARIDLHTGNSSSAAAIAVSGADVYIAGSYTEGGAQKACYWKNTAKYDLPVTGTDSSFASAITISGADVYTAGMLYTDGTEKACYWKNTDRIDLAVPGTATSSFAYVITVTR